MLTNYSFDKKIIILSKDEHGLGDIMCGFKMAKYFNYQLNFSKESFILVIESNKDKLFIESLNKHNFNFFINDDPTILRKYLKEVNPRFILMIPTNSTCIDDINVPILKINEYGRSYDHRQYSLGLCKHDLGIFINHDLRISSQHSIKQLQFVSQKLQIAILDQVYSDVIISSFINHSKLFFGYGSMCNIRLQFVEAIIELEYKLSSTDKNLVFLLMGSTLFDEGTRQLLEANPNIDIIELIPILKGLNIELELIGLDKDKYYRSRLTSTKKVRIIWSRLSSDEVKYLLMASEKEVLATGDQSLSEVISAGKHFIYETLSHKQDTLLHLKKLMGKINVNLKMLYEKSYQNKYGNTLEPSELAKLFYHSRNKEISDYWEKLIDEICNNRVIGTNFNELLVNYLSGYKVNFTIEKLF